MTAEKPALIERRYSKSHLTRQLERDELRRETLTADGDDNVLFAVQHICHRSAGLSGRHIYRAHFSAGRFVVGTQHRADLAGRSCERTALTRDDQRPGP